MTLSIYHTTRVKGKVIVKWRSVKSCSNRGTTPATVLND